MAGQTGGGGGCKRARKWTHMPNGVHICASFTGCESIPVLSFEHTIFARHRVAFGTCVCLHVCTEED